MVRSCGVFQAIVSSWVGGSLRWVVLEGSEQRTALI